MSITARGRGTQPGPSGVNDWGWQANIWFMPRVDCGVVGRNPDGLSAFVDVKVAGGVLHIEPEMPKRLPCWTWIPVILTIVVPFIVAEVVAEGVEEAHEAPNAFRTFLFYTWLIELLLSWAIFAAKLQAQKNQTPLVDLLKFGMRFSRTTSPSFQLPLKPQPPEFTNEGVLCVMKRDGIMDDEPCAAYLSSDNIVTGVDRENTCCLPAVYDEVVQEIYVTPNMLLAGTKIGSHPCCCTPAYCFASFRPRDFLFTFVSLASEELKGVEYSGVVNKLPKFGGCCGCCKTDPSNGARQVEIAMCDGFPIVNQAFVEKRLNAYKDTELGGLETPPMLELRKALAIVMAQKQALKAANIQGSGMMNAFQN